MTERPKTKGQAAIRALFRTAHDRTGNLPAFPGIFPDQLAPIVRNSVDGERELVMARWGMPGPLQFGGQPVTNIRNVASPRWCGWLSARNRCLVPATSFCECADTRPRKTPTWFALSEERPLFAFAGLWTPWLRGPKSAQVEGEHELFGFLTTEANAIVAPIHPKAIPLILTTTEEFDLWLEGETVEALKLQRPLPDGMLVWRGASRKIPRRLSRHPNFSIEFSRILCSVSPWAKAPGSALRGPREWLGDFRAISFLVEAAVFNPAARAFCNFYMAVD
jgi:putative SOS response-associated peptidase YedK